MSSHGNIIRLGHDGQTTARRLIGLLSWWDEPPRDLRTAIRGYRQIGMTHLAVVDGAYGIFPGATPVSDKRQHAAIAELCNELGIDLLIYLPFETWPTETQKRGFMFQLAAQEFATTPDDWFVIVDADERVLNPFDVRPLLSHIAEPSADLFMIEPAGGGKPEKREPLRKFFRALPGLTTKLNHFTFVAGERVLWGYGAERSFDLTSLRIEHTTNLRSRRRRELKEIYYRQRDEIGLEPQDGCYKCGEPATTIVKSDLDISGGPQGVQIKSTKYRCCDRHGKRLRFENAKVLSARMGSDHAVWNRAGVEIGMWCNTPKDDLSYAFVASEQPVPKVLAAR